MAQALKGIRADLPVAMASAYITEELRAMVRVVGLPELICKPDAIDSLCEIVVRLFDVQGGTGNPA